MNKENYTGVIFDFNGTILWDTKLHNEAWDIFLSSYNISLTDEEKSRSMHGKTNKEILNYLFNTTLEDTLLTKYINEKETIYQDLCVKSKLYFAPGVVDFWGYLKQKNIDYAIATSSGRENIEFYLSYFKLDNWFDVDKIVYNNGSIKSKPDPEIFLVAMEKLNKEPGEIVIFEDSIAGIIAAEKSNPGKIVIVNSNQDDYSKFNYEIISDFNYVDKNIFNS